MPPKLPRPLGEAEQSVLGAILVRPEVLDKIVDVLTPQDFLTPAHATIYRAMLDLYEQRKPVDLVTVNEALKVQGALDAVGGPGFLAGLSEKVGFATNANHYAALVKDRSLLYQLWSAGEKITKAATVRVKDVRGLVDRAGELLFKMADQGQG
jgi:replicative DNA helicase